MQQGEKYHLLILPLDSEDEVEDPGEVHTVVEEAVDIGQTIEEGHMAGEEAEAVVLIRHQHLGGTIMYHLRLW